MNRFPDKLYVGRYMIKVSYGFNGLETDTGQPLFGIFEDTKLTITVSCLPGIPVIQVLATLIHEYCHAVIFCQGHRFTEESPVYRGEESTVRLMESAFMTLVMDNPGILDLIKTVLKDYENVKKGKESMDFLFPVPDEEGTEFGR